MSLPSHRTASVRIAITVALALFAFSWAPTVTAAESIDEQQTLGNYGTADRNGFWQAVAVDATRITKVQVLMWGCSSAEPYRLIVSTTTSHTSGVLADYQSYMGFTSTSSWMTYDFADISTSPGQVLYLHFRPTTLAGPYCGQSSMNLGNNNPYTRGDMSWGSTYDVAFKVYGDYYPSTLSSGVVKTDTIFATAGDARHYEFGVWSPNGYTHLNVQLDDTASGSDFDLYVRRDARPTTSAYDCAPLSGSNVENCDFPNPAWGTYYIMVLRWSGSGSFTIKATGSSNQAPNAPSLSSPSDGANKQSNSLSLTWSPPSPADPNGDVVTYTTYLGTSNAQPPGGAISCSGTTTRTCATGTLAWETTHYWQVKADDGKGGVTWSARRSFTTNYYPYTPSNHQNSGSGVSITLSWSGGDPDGTTPYYTVYMGTSNPPTATVSGCVDIQMTSPSCSPPGIAWSTSYYWKIKSSDHTISGAWLEREGSVQLFTTGPPPNNPPNAPSLSSPSDGATRQANSLSLTWSQPSPPDPNGDAVTYTTYLGTSNAQPPGGAISCSGTTTRTCPSGTLSWGTTHYWQVKADDGKSGGVTWSERRSFTTNQYPYTPSNHQNTGSGVSITLSWSGGDPDGTTPFYTVYMGTSNPPTTTVSGCVDIQTQTPTCSPTGIAWSTTYYWKVKSSDHTISGSWLEREGSVQTFTTAPPPNNNPFTPGNSAPSNGAAGQSRTPVFSWTSNGDPDAGDTVTFTVVANGQNVCTATFPTRTCTSTVTFAKGVSVSWRVTAADNRGGSSQSAATSFTVQPNRAPTATFTSSTTALTASFDASASSDADGDPLSYVWYVPDGPTTYLYYTVTPQHTFSCDQTSTVLLQVMDSDNAWTETTRAVTVADDRDSESPTPDGLVRCREDAQGTSDFDIDSDDDGLTDLIESTVFANRDAVFCNGARTTCAYPHPTEQDLYVEIDWYRNAARGSLLYTSGQLQAFRNAFANAPRVIHYVMDTGQLGGGQDLGLGGDGDWGVVVQPNYDNPNTFATARHDIFHYHIVACTGGAGQGQAPGDISVVWNCGGDAAWTTAAFLHELGHNLAGYRHVAGNATATDTDCQWFVAHSNPALPSHFDHTRGEHNCDDANGIDTYEHSTAEEDSMFGGFLSTQTDYRDDTWNAFRLDLGVGPARPTCADVLPYLGAVSNAINGVVRHCVSDTPHMDAPPPAAGSTPGASGLPLGIDALWAGMGVAMVALRRRLG